MWGRLKCALGFHSCHTQSDDNYVWGECDRCHRKWGVTSRYAIRCYIEAVELAKAMAADRQPVPGVYGPDQGLAPEGR